MADNKDVILAAMKKAGKPMKNGEVAVATGIDKGEVGKLMNQLKKEGKVTSPKNCFYEPV